MFRIKQSISTAAVLLPLAASAVSAQHLHTNDEWDECALVLSPTLTQTAWRQFAREVGLVAYFRPLASARPLGKREVEFSVLNWGTKIDAHDPAWNDTFSHPDSTHWLFEGDALKIPGLMLRAGITDRLDAGVYFTKSMGANYGFLGGQLQYSFLNDSKQSVAAAGRLSAVTVYGPEDASASVFGADLLVSKTVSYFSPYAGVSGYLSRAVEHTNKVNLKDENIFGLQGMLGVEARVSFVRIAAEYNLAKVPGYSIKVGFGS